MNRYFLFVVASVAMLLFGCDALQDVDNPPIDNPTPKSEQIATSAQQLVAIKVTLPKLEATCSLFEEFARNVSRMDARSATRGSASVVDDIDAHVSNLRGVVAELEDYISEGTDGTSWLDVTYKTLDQYIEVASLLAAMEVELETVKSKIEGVTDDMCRSLLSSIEQSLNFMDGWTCALLTGYYDMLVLRATLDEALDNYIGDDPAVHEAVAALVEELNSELNALKKAHREAILTAMAWHEGGISDQEYNIVEEANDAFQERVEELKERVEECVELVPENDYEGLVGRIESVVCFGRESDGQSVIDVNFHTGEIEGGFILCSFTVAPSDIITDIHKVWDDLLSFEVKYENSDEVVQLPISICSLISDDSEITLWIDADLFTEEFFWGEVSAMASIVISYGDSRVVSEPVKLVPNYGDSFLRQIHYQADSRISIDPELFDAGYFQSHNYSELHDAWVIMFSEPVTAVGEEAFANANMTEITLPDSVTTLGDYAFSGCTLLEQIHIGDAVVEIGEGCFADSGVTMFTGSNVTEDGRCVIVDNELLAFASCGVSEYVVPESVEAIRDGVFAECAELVSVTIPDSVTSVGNKTFYNCSSLESVVLSENLGNISSNMFDGCTSLKQLVIPDSVTSIGDNAFGACTSLESVHIGANVETMEVGMFDDCLSLRSVSGKFASQDGRCLVEDGVLKCFAQCGVTEYSIPEEVKRVPEGIFTGNSHLTRVTFPGDVERISDDAFAECVNVVLFTFLDATPPLLGTMVFQGIPDLRISVPMEYLDEYCVTWPSDYVDAIIELSHANVREFPESFRIYYTTSDGEVLFGRLCEDGSRVLLHEYQNGVGMVIFSRPLQCIYHSEIAQAGTANLQSIILPDKLQEICEYAFAAQDKLGSVVIPDSVTTIADYAFAWCFGLDTVVIGSGVRSIGIEAINSANTIYCRSTTPPRIGDYAFDTWSDSLRIYVPTESVQSYKSAWHEYADYIYGYDLE